MLGKIQIVSNIINKILSVVIQMNDNTSTLVFRIIGKETN